MTEDIEYYTAQVWREVEATHFISYCPELDLYSEGNDAQEAFEAIGSAIGLYLETYQELNDPDLT